ncbi:MAG: uroporphyrinogen-III synthase, partial [Novosphingobium sp.]
LLIGSANALRHGGPGLAAYRGKPASAVGAHTAAAARAAGFDVVAVGEGGLQAVLDRLGPSDQRLLRLAGATRVPLVAPPGVTIDEQIVYASEPLPYPEPLAALLREPAVALLHSAEAARRFAQLCDHHAIPRARLVLAAIGPRVASAAGSGWGRLAVATAPNDAALLALAGEMCQASDGLNDRHGR